MSANPQYAVGEVIANKYVVEGLLGESPSGHVYLANSGIGGQKIAVKCYRTDVSTRLLESPDFFLKAAAMTEIEHDNICACLDVQEEMGSVFVARAYAEGQTFEEWLKLARSDSNYYPRGIELLWQVSQGLATLHEKTRHLNIHPGNLIVGPLTAKLCDWDPRALHAVEMTPESMPWRNEYRGYRAPEASSQGSFLSYPSTDLFAVAGLLYRLVKGENPASNSAQTLQETRGLDKEIASFLAKALQPKPEDRFQEASNFSDALWDLKSAMQRLQERNVRSPIQKPVELQVAVAPAAMHKEYNSSGKEPTLMGLTQAPASGNDTFFSEFATPEVPVKPQAKPVVAKSSPDTLFGTPVFPSSMEDSKSLASSGTLFGSQPPLFAEPVKPKKKAEPIKPIPDKPIAVSISSLERDPLDMAGGNATGGFTQFGFKGAGENRTGIFIPEPKGLSPRAKLMITLAAVGGLLLLLCLGGLFLFLRKSTTSPEAQAVTAPPPPVQDNSLPSNLGPQSVPEPTPVAAALPPEAKPVAPPPKPTPVEVRQTPKPPVVKANIEVEQPVATKQVNSKISAERIAKLMTMVETRTWPATAVERLRAADDFNDLHKTAEANMAYGKTLAAGDVTEKQKILALGGLAVTFQAMGMPDQAKEAVDRILAINPRNAFALKLKEKM